MSASTAAARVAPVHGTSAEQIPRPAGRQPSRPPVRAPKARLRVVPAPRRSATRLGLLCVALLGGGLLVLLMLNITLSKGAYELTGLQAQQRELADQQQALAENVEAQSAPQKLAAAAQKLGMVPAPNTAFINPDGSVKGIPATATAPPAPKPAPRATAKPAASGKAADTPATTKKTTDSKKPTR